VHNDFADRKNGRQPVSYDHPDLESILGETSGLMIYQEDIMRVATLVAGFSMTEADDLRKACSKKIREMIRAQRSKFVDGAERQGTVANSVRRSSTRSNRSPTTPFPRATRTATPCSAIRTRGSRRTIPWSTWRRC
jgi:hypothetical protein